MTQFHTNPESRNFDALKGVHHFERAGKHFVEMKGELFEKLCTKIEDLEDLAVIRQARKNPPHYIPLALVKRQLAGESPLKIWREFRAMTQEKLAEISCVSRGMIAGIEAGHKQGAVGTLKKLANALDCDIDSLT